jgi:hypothetical protein
MNELNDIIDRKGSNGQLLDEKAKVSTAPLDKKMQQMAIPPQSLKDSVNIVTDEVSDPEKYRGNHTFTAAGDIKSGNHEPSSMNESRERTNGGGVLPLHQRQERITGANHFQERQDRLSDFTVNFSNTFGDNFSQFSFNTNSNSNMLLGNGVHLNNDNSSSNSNFSFDLNDVKSPLITHGNGPSTVNISISNNNNNNNGNININGSNEDNDHEPIINSKGLLNLSHLSQAAKNVASISKGLRRGKWSEEEDSYANRLIDEFKVSLPEIMHYSFLFSTFYFFSFFHCASSDVFDNYQHTHNNRPVFYHFWMAQHSELF